MHQLKGTVMVLIFCTFLSGFSSCVNKGSRLSVLIPRKVIWNHPSDPSKNTIICNNHPDGLNVYNLTGQKIYQYNYGAIRELFVFYNCSVGGKQKDLLAGITYFGNRIIFFEIDARSGTLKQTKLQPEGFRYF